MFSFIRDINKELYEDINDSLENNLRSTFSCIWFQSCFEKLLKKFCLENKDLIEIKETEVNDFKLCDLLIKTNNCSLFLWKQIIDIDNNKDIFKNLNTKANDKKHNHTKFVPFDPDARFKYLRLFFNVSSKIYRIRNNREPPDKWDDNIAIELCSNDAKDKELISAYKKAQLDYLANYNGNYNEFYKGINKERYVLRTKGNNPLVCVGLRPSTSNKREPDEMTQKADIYAKKQGYDGVIIINLYPQRSYLPLEAKKALIVKNEFYIEKMLRDLREETGKAATLWAAWDDGYDKQNMPYLENCLHRIVKIADKYSCNWEYVRYTENGNPCNPSDLDEYEMESLRLRPFYDIKQFV